ncbi:MAG TPA: sugar phosphate nucleotidyltransferase, partial [Acidobacteriota bacterium]|nr:sugar phosphate nucleotidyltransferase [Acidobacteriota bacterium]
ALEGSDFFLFLADEVLINPRHREMVEAFQDPDVFALCGVVEVEDRSRISRTYAMIYNHQDRQIYRLIEKPRNPLNNTQGTGNCLFRNQILDYISLTPINQQRKEKELPDLIQCAVDDGKLVRAFEIGSWYANVNTLEELRLEHPELYSDPVADSSH